MIGVLINFAAMIIGSLAGALFKKGIPQRVTGAVMSALGICVVYVGVTGSLNGENTVAIILSLVIGTVIGTIINIDNALEKLGEKIKNKFTKKESNSNIGNAMVTATLICCVGGMAIVGSLEAGINGNNTILITKAILDFIIIIMLTATLGIGTIFASIPLLIYQGTLVLLSEMIQPYLTEAMINDISCTGSLMIIALGANMLKITDLKVANLLPALLLSPFFTYVFSLLL